MVRGHTNWTWPLLKHIQYNEKESTHKKVRIIQTCKRRNKNLLELLSSLSGAGSLLSNISENRMPDAKQIYT